MQNIQYLPVTMLKVRPDNPRHIDKGQLKILCESVKANPDYFETRPILCNKDFFMFAGTMRCLAAKRIGMKKVPVAVMDIPEERQREIMLRDNHQNGEWDFSKLKFFDADLLLEVGFTDDDLSEMWVENLEACDDDFDEIKELAKIKKPKTRSGDLLQLGPHKIVCADATDPAVLKKLFGKEKASMVYSDPPYNISLDYNAGVGGKQRYGGSVNDSRTDDEYRLFLKKTLINALSVSKPDVHVYYWSDQTYIWLIQTLYRELGIENKRVLIWIKNSQSPVPTATYNKCYEPCTYGLRGRPYVAKNIRNANEVMNKEMSTGNNLHNEVLDHLDIWVVKRLPSKDYLHATSKPPQLHQKAIRRCTKPGDIILDSFSGSSSTLISADQLKRRVYAVELEPVFCDLAAKRYERLTGVKAKYSRL